MRHGVDLKEIEPKIAKGAKERPGGLRRTCCFAIFASFCSNLGFAFLLAAVALYLDSFKYAAMGFCGSDFKPAMTTPALNSAPAWLVCTRSSAKSGFTAASPRAS